MWDGKSVYRILIGKPEEKKQGVDGMMILRWNFRKWYMGVWTGLGCLRIETGGRQL
jgi:hypothetical protein